jgi:hypothetical protein
MRRTLCYDWFKLFKGGRISVVVTDSYLRKEQRYLFRPDCQCVCVYKEFSLGDVVSHAETIKYRKLYIATFIRNPDF